MKKSKPTQADADALAVEIWDAFCIPYKLRPACAIPKKIEKSQTPRHSVVVGSKNKRA